MLANALLCILGIDGGLRMCSNSEYLLKTYARSSQLKVQPRQGRNTEVLHLTEELFAADYAISRDSFFLVCGDPRRSHEPTLIYTKTELIRWSA